MKTGSMLNLSNALARFLEIIPESAGPVLVGLMTGDQCDLKEVETALAQIDWRSHRDVVEDLLRAILPVEELVPDGYEKWRPVVRDGFAFVGARLSPERLVPKLVEQLSLPETTPVEDRIIAFIRRVPSLQKIGQTIARNRDLNPAFRAQLVDLEDAIHEVDEAEIHDEIKRQLGNVLAENQIAVEPGLYAEGSVSALVRFTRKTPPGSVDFQAGVFKVLKPFIPQYFHEDLTLLGELAEYFASHEEKYDVGNLHLRGVLNDVRDLFVRETDFVSERASLVAAAQRYADIPGIRIPIPFTDFSTDTITAMTEERSVKVTDAFLDDPLRRAEIARRLIAGLVSLPLFSSEESAPFHADPHAGNLRVDETTGDVVLLDWALTDSLSLEDRRNFILLVLALPLRDEEQMLTSLSGFSKLKTESERNLIKQRIEMFIDALPLWSIPGPGSLNELMAVLVRQGVRFSSSFLIFRKMLATLGDVVEQLSAEVTIEATVLDHALGRKTSKTGSPAQPELEVNIPLKFGDVFRIGVTAQLFLPRVWAQSVRSVIRKSCSGKKSGDMPVEISELPT